MELRRGESGVASESGLLKKQLVALVASGGRVSNESQELVCDVCWLFVFVVLLGRRDVICKFGIIRDLIVTHEIFFLRKKYRKNKKITIIMNNKIQKNRIFSYINKNYYN